MGGVGADAGDLFPAEEGGGVRLRGEPEFDLGPNTPWGRSVTEAEFHQMCQTSRIEGELLERFWRMNDYQSPMPAYITVVVSKSDVEKLVRKLERAPRGANDKSHDRAER